MGRFARLCLAAVSCTLPAALGPGCTTEQPTQIVVSVNTDFSLGSEVDELRLDIRRQDDELGDFAPVKEVREPLRVGDGLPLTLALTRAEHGSNTVKVTAEGWLGDTLVVRRIAVAHFVTGRV